MEVSILAISADHPDKLGEKLLPAGFTFPLLGDPGGEVIEAYGLRHPGGNPLGGDIARPALIFVDREGRVALRLLTENWRIRPTPEQILSEAKRVLGPGRS